MVDIEACKEKGILVCTAGGANAVSVAEIAIFNMLYCAKKFKAVQAHMMEDYRFAKMGIKKGELEGKTLGLIGTGNIGALVAQKAHFGFNMEVIAFDPFAKNVPEYIHLVEDRDEVFKQADFVSLHVPALPSTIHSVSDHEFDLMKETAYLINTARGAIVDEPALIRALQEKKIAGAGLDTVEKEPFDLDNPLLSMENVRINGCSDLGAWYDTDRHAPHIVNASFMGIRSEVLLHALAEKGIYVSSGSACSSNHPAISGTLSAIGVSKDLLDSTLRFSFSPETTEEEIALCADALRELVPVLSKYRRG